MPISRASEGGDQFKAAEHAGELLLITPTATDEVTTSNKNNPIAEVTICDIAVLDEDRRGRAIETFDGAYMFPKVVQSQLKKARLNGEQVVGRLFSDKKAQKSGQSAPWKLTQATDEEVEIAEAYIAAQAKPKAKKADPLADDDDAPARSLGGERRGRQYQDDDQDEPVGRTSRRRGLVEVGAED